VPDTPAGPAGPGPVETAKRRAQAETAHREVAGGIILSRQEGVQSVSLGKEAVLDLYGRPKRPGERDVDIVATTTSGGRLLGEGKGLASPQSAIDQLEKATKEFNKRSIQVDGYYVFVKPGDLTKPGYAISDGVLMFNGAPYLIDGKPIYVVETHPNPDQIRALI
jgi:hypothetical protein